MTETVHLEHVRNTLITAVCSELRLAPEQLRTDVALTEYGVESVTALAIAVELEDELGLRGLDPTLMWDFPTVDALSSKVTELYTVAHTASPTQAVGTGCHARPEAVTP